MTAPTMPAKLPSYVEAALARPIAERQTWTYGIATNYIAIFLWVAFFDQLARSTLNVGGLLPTVLGAAAGGVLAYLLLFLAPARFGLANRQPFEIVATSTFGVRGAKWLAHGLMAAVQVAVLAIAVSYAVDFTFRGLISARLLDAFHLQPIIVGGVALPSLLFLFTSLVWCVAASLVGAGFSRWIAAIMLVFPIFPALLLGGATLWAIIGIAGGAPPVVPALVTPQARTDTFLVMVQFVFAFFAVAGAQSVDWGASSRDARDVTIGGLVGVAMAAPIIAALVLVTIAGAQARAGAPPAPPVVDAQLRPGQIPAPEAPINRDAPVSEPRLATFGSVLQLGIGGSIGGMMLMVFGLGSLAPAVYAAYIFGRRLHELSPVWRRVYWTLVGSALAFVLIALGITSHLDRTFSLLGAAFAPVVGALTSEYVRAAGRWPGPRRGYNPAGIVAWLLGFAVGLIPVIGQALESPTLSRVQPAAVLAFVTGFLVNSLVARAGLEPAAIPPLRRDASGLDSPAIVIDGTRP